MNYAQAAALVSQHAPDLLIDPEVAGQMHVNVRRTATSDPFSITLPVSTGAVPLTDEQLQELFVASLAIAAASV